MLKNLSKNYIKVFKNIEKVKVYPVYNTLTGRAFFSFAFTTKRESNDLWYKLFDKFFENVDSDKIIYEFIITILRINKIKSIDFIIDDTETREKSLQKEELTIYMEGNREIKFAIPHLKTFSSSSIFEFLKVKKDFDFIFEYLNNEIDNIIMFPSNISSEIQHFNEIKNQKNILSIFNYYGENDMAKSIKIDDSVDSIIHDFIATNIKNIESYYKNDKKIVITFDNNKSINIYDVEYINKHKEDFDNIIDKLIDKKINENKRKVIKYERHDNGKNG